MDRFFALHNNKCVLNKIFIVIHSDLFWHYVKYVKKCWPSSSISLLGIFFIDCSRSGSFHASKLYIWISPVLASIRCFYAYEQVYSKQAVASFWLIVIMNISFPRMFAIRFIWRVFCWNVNKAYAQWIWRMNYVHTCMQHNRTFSISYIRFVVIMILEWYMLYGGACALRLCCTYFQIEWMW